MSELVVIVTDLYLASGEDAADARAAGAVLEPGAARFGPVASVPDGWRRWLAAWLGRADLALASPAAVASAGESASALGTARAASVWFADPVHLLAGLTSVHLAPQGLLALDPAGQAELCGSFDETFADAGYRLTPTRAGRFLLHGRASSGEVQTSEPARVLGSSVADLLPKGTGAAALLALGAEIEMWLHEHPLNARRARERLPPISTLWLWGGGAPLDAAVGAPRCARAPHAAAAIFSDDEYVRGLSHLCGVRAAPAPSGIDSVASDAAPRLVVALELFCAGAGLHSAHDRLAAFEREWVLPALGLLRRGELSRLTIIANDRRVSTIARDRLKIWRRPRAAIEALR